MLFWILSAGFSSAFASNAPSNATSESSPAAAQTALSTPAKRLQTSNNLLGHPSFFRHPKNVPESHPTHNLGVQLAVSNAFVNVVRAVQAKAMHVTNLLEGCYHLLERVQCRAAGADGNLAEYALRFY